MKKFINKIFFFKKKKKILIKKLQNIKSFLEKK